MKWLKQIICLVVIGGLIAVFTPNLKGAGEGGEDNGSSHNATNHSVNDESISMKLDNLAVSEESKDFLKEITAQDDPINKTRNAFILEKKDDSITWAFDIAHEGDYKIEMEYLAADDRQTSVDMAVKVNGALPFDNAGSIILNRIYRNESSEQLTDDYGNERTPQSVEVKRWSKYDLQEFNGYTDLPHLFTFKKGRNTLTLSVNTGAVAITQITLIKGGADRTYSEYLDHHKNQPDIKDAASGDKRQAEDLWEKSSPAIRAVQDRSNAALEPQSPTTICLNILDGGNWKQDGQWISYKINVKEEGFYNIALKYKQSALRGLFVTRKLYINGEIPFKEAADLRFSYTRKWQIQTLGNQEDSYKFYLKKGENDLRLEVVFGELSKTLEGISSTIYDLNTLYRKIIMITGVNPDPMRDYYLSDEIPTLMDDLNRIKSALESELERIETVTGLKGTALSALSESIYMLNRYIKDSETICDDLTIMKDNISALGTMQLTLQEQPLSLDYILVSAVDSKMPKANSGFFEALFYEVKSLFYSFFSNYNSFGTGAQENVNVWVNSGRDQTVILRNLIDDHFLDIPVQLTIISADNAIQATLAGKGPDVILMAAKSYPINLAMRDALYPLSSFEDFDKVAERFKPSAMISGVYQNQNFALPETQNFGMLFYRTDIFEELKLESPKTWEDFYKVTAVLQRNNMTVGISEGMGTFEMFLYQRGLTFYKDSLTETNFDSQEALDAFNEWTALYKQLNLPRPFDFYNRFRTGEMPMSIQSYTMFNTLSVAAPEIRQQWAMAPIPSRITSDGEETHAQPSDGNTCMILNNAKNPDNAWTFLKWWTSADIQAQYGNNIEALLGTAARYDTANLEAFSKLNWTPEQQAAIEYQWQYVVDSPQIPGNYIVGRHLVNAFRNVCDFDKNTREMLIKYDNLINAELERKNAEFNN